MSFKKTQLAFVVATTMGLTGCFGGVDAPNFPDVVLPPPPATIIDVEVSGNVVDFTTGAAISGATLTFLSEGAATIEPRLLDDDLTRVSELTATNGSFAFGFDQFTDISNVTILVEADGFLSETIVFDINNAADENTLAFTLVSATAQGVTVTEQTNAVAGGVVATEVVIEAAATTGASKVTIPAGVVLQDEDGNAISGANVTFQVVAIDSDDAGDDSLSVAELLPAGLQDATSTDVFSPVAATTINFVDSNGNKITRFTSPITVAMNIPASRGVTEGQELTLKSYDEDTGLWTSETNTVTVGALSNGFYPGTFQISHLTTFAAGKVVANDKCATASSVNFTGDAAVNGLIFNMTRSISGRVTRTLAADAAQLTFADTQSASETANITVKDGSGNVWGSASNAAICGAVNVVLTAPSTLSETLNVTATCAGDDTVFTADTNAVVTYRAEDATGAFLTAPHIANGNYLLSALEEDATYNVNINSGIAGVSDYSVQITADGVDESAPITYDCNTGTGTGGTGGTGGGGI
ncbi:MAG: hypothetical protein P8J70_08380 [Glaciecola sp.]|nr:hypothetical protein [Glaciecola sp.]MDG2099675.1 hypothetical protein [Glaciecola sp.]